MRAKGSQVTVSTRRRVVGRTSATAGGVAVLVAVAALLPGLASASPPAEAAAASAVPAALPAAGPPPPTGQLVGSWQFNGAPGATTEPDASGTGNVLTVDPRHAGVSTGRYEPADASGYVHVDDGILQAPSNATLEPGSRDIRIDIRVRVTDGWKGANFIQKGTTADSASGFWKIEMTQYQVRCRFIGSQGSARLQSHDVVGDGEWHTITCTKTASAADLWIDGVPEAHADVVVGANLNTTDAVSVGGKTVPGQVDPDDLLSGDIDYATYRLG